MLSLIVAAFLSSLLAGSSEVLRISHHFIGRVAVYIKCGNDRSILCRLVAERMLKWTQVLIKSHALFVVEIWSDFVEIINLRVVETMCDQSIKSIHRHHRADSHINVLFLLFYEQCKTVGIFGARNGCQRTRTHTHTASEALQCLPPRLLTLNCMCVLREQAYSLAFVSNVGKSDALLQSTSKSLS